MVQSLKKMPMFVIPGQPLYFREILCNTPLKVHLFFSSMSLCLNIFNNDTLALDSSVSVAVACRLLGNGEGFGVSRCRWLHCQCEGGISSNVGRKCGCYLLDTKCFCSLPFPGSYILRLFLH